jgi:hypothetical protein
MIALLIAERYKKQPQRIQTAITESLRKVGNEIAGAAIDRISFEADTWERMNKRS